MKKYQIVVCALCMLLYAAPSAHADNKVQRQGEAALKKLMERASPSKADNDALSLMLGNWEYTVTVWDKPKTEPEQASGIITNEMVLGNRFLASSLSGHISVDGHLALLKAQGMIGYDKAKKAYTSVWTDTLSTGMMIGSARYDEKARTLTETGRFTNPLTGLEEKFRTETKFIDSDNYKRTIFAVNKAGKEARLMEFAYTRKN